MKSQHLHSSKVILWTHPVTSRLYPDDSQGVFGLLTNLTKHTPKVSKLQLEQLVSFYEEVDRKIDPARDFRSRPE